MDIDPSYATFLDTVHSNINLGKWGNKNLLIASPIAHSKTIMAYSAINCMFRAGISVFPIFDVLEISRILTDMDMGKESVYDVSQPERVLTVPILFAKIPRSPRWDVYDNIALLIDRRVRRGTSTILLYDGTREQLIRNDKQEVLTGMFGNGYFGTIEVKSWGISNSKDLWISSLILMVHTEKTKILVRYMQGHLSFVEMEQTPYSLLQQEQTRPT